MASGNESGTELNLQGSLKKTEALATFDVNVEINIRNSSSISTKAGGKVAIRDQDEEVTREATFPAIASRSTSTQTLRMPGGIEQAAWRFEPEDGSDNWFGIGYGVNVRIVNLTLTD